jgi:6-phosphogluconolactonase (cycloisomerase 2 family)
MSLASRKLIQATAGAAGAADTGDDDFANVVLLLDGDGTSGDDNNTFTDSSTNGFTVTESGDVVQGSFSPYGDNWSVYFENNTAFMQSDTGIDVSTDNFTIEMWVWSTEADVRFCSQNNTGSTNFYFGTNEAGKLKWDVPTGTNVVSADYVMPLNQWVHVAAVREGTGSNQFKMYADGVLVAQDTDSSGHGTGRKINIAGGRGNSANYDGYISNFRFVVGSAVYTSDFTPPTEPLTNITNTKLLACQSNRFIDNSATNDTFTLDLDTGLPKVTPFSPFKDDDARDITTDGGSGYFDGSGDFLRTSTSSVSIGTGDFTMEAWVYPAVSSQSGVILDTRSGSFNNKPVISYVNSTFRYYASSADRITSAASYPAGAWYHCVAVRNSGTTTLYVNGVSQGTYSDSTDYGTITRFEVGADDDGSENAFFNGNVSDARFVSSAVYTSAFTPPTAPLNATAVEGSAYSLNNASYEFKSVSVTSQATTPTGVQFNSDGTKMYVIDFDNDDIFQYSLSTAFDVSTASYDSVSFDGSSQETKPQGLVFSPDGTKMYTVGQTADSFFQYSLSTAFDLSTVSYASKSFSVASQDLTPTDLAISPDGTKMYMIGVTSDSIFEYDLSTAFDVSTASYNSVSLSLSAQDTSPRGLHFNSDGTKMFVAGDSSNSVLQYTLTTGFDLSTASYDSVSFSIGSEEGTPTALTFNADGTKFYILGSANDTVYQYSVSTVSALMLNFQDAGIYDLTGINNIDTVGDAQIDTAVKKYGTGSLEFDGSGDYLEAPYNKAYAFSGDFTVEFWIYYISHVGSYTGIICCANTHTGSGAPTAGWILSFYSTGDDLLWEIAGQGGFTSTSSLSKNQWVHLAVVRSGSTVTLYMDGVSVGSKTQSGTADSVSFPLFVGRGRSTVSTPYFEGYIDDIRITNGIARYTSSFTPPDAALPKF